MDGTLRGASLPKPKFRLAPISEELQHVRGFSGIQTFFPTLSKLYRLSKYQSSDVWLDSKWRVVGLDISGTSGPCSLNLVPNQDVLGACAADTDAAAAAPTKRPAFLKVTHLLDPVRWMKGSYSLPKHGGLPWHNRTWTNAWTKLQDPWNQAYVESLAAYALGRLREEGVTPHFNLFYGAFCARADAYRYNLTDDFSSFRNTRWFWNGQKKGLYSVRIVDTQSPNAPVDKAIVDEILQEPDLSDESDEDIEEVDVLDEEQANNDAGSIHTDDSMSELSYASSSDASSATDASSSTDASSATDDSEGVDDEPYRIYAEFKDFPVMLIALEENEGTMDSLLEHPKEVGAEPDTPEWELRWSAWLFQVIAALSAAQDLLGFTHNDLHTNNIVWSHTEEEYLYYTNRAGATFKVPTFGKLFRIIDFGRAIFRINQHIFISDDFRNGNDAEGQYCFKPLHPRPPAGYEVAPNPSFDLCRLAVSLFEPLFSEAPEEKEGGAILSSEDGMEVRETVSPLYNVLWSWMIDDHGRNVLVEPDGEERFPDFDLYKHIAANVHSAVPARQFSHPAFDRFQVEAAAVPSAARRWSLFA